MPAGNRVAPHAAHHPRAQARPDPCPAVHLIPGTKQASDSLAQTRAIMDTIYQENPSHWPHGVSPEMCDGGCWLVREASSQAPVGFAGWQERNEGFKKIGYYAIGILPEWRNQGLARQAVRQVIGAKSAGVAEVRAYIVPGNVPSENLAHSLGVPVVKMAGMALLKKVLGYGAAATLPALWQDDTTRDPTRAWTDWNDKGRIEDMAGTALGYGGAAAAFASKRPGIGALLSVFPAFKTTAFNMMRHNHWLESPAAQAGQVAQARATQHLADTTGMSTPMKWTLGLGAGALGLGALLNSKRQSDAVQEIADASDKGRVRVKLPTNKPGDQETEIDMPFEQMDISNALRGAIARDTKRRLRSESASRVMHRGTPASAAKMPDVFPAQTSTLTA